MSIDPKYDTVGGHDPDQWTASDDLTHEGTCEHCDRPSLVRHLPDPYIEELYPEDENASSDWCYSCWSRRKEEV